MADIVKDNQSCQITDDTIIFNFDDDSSMTTNDQQEHIEEPRLGCSKEDWSSYTPDRLKTPLSKKLCIKNNNGIEKRKPKIVKKTNVTKKYVGLKHKLLEEKLNFIKLQKEKFLEEHSLRMEILKKKLELVNKKLTTCS